MKKKKITLNKITVKSFVTEMDESQVNTVKGGFLSIWNCGGGGKDTNQTDCAACTIGSQCSQLNCPTDNPCAPGGGQP